MGLKAGGTVRSAIVFMRSWRLFKWLKTLLGLRRGVTTSEKTTIKTISETEITFERETRATD